MYAKSTCVKIMHLHIADTAMCKSYLCYDHGAAQRCQSASILACCAGSCMGSTEWRGSGAGDALCSGHSG